jgi:hypothetical protein
METRNKMAKVGIVELDEDGKIIHLYNVDKSRKKTIQEDVYSEMEEKRQREENEKLLKLKYGAHKQMSDETKLKLKEKNKLKREEKKDLLPVKLVIKTRPVKNKKVFLVEPKTAKQISDEVGVTDADRKLLASTIKKSKLSLYEDPEAQKIALKKYSWIKPNSFRQDPDKLNATIVDIICQVCYAIRTVHAADVFQVKKCLVCKKKKV